MSNIKQEEIGKMKEGRYVVIDDVACKITKMQKSAPGKHGHAKYRVDAVDIISGSKKVIMLTGHAKIGVPIIEKKGAQVLSITGSSAQVMDMENYQTFDIEIPDDLKAQIQPNAQVVYWDILGKKVLKQVK